MACSFRRRTVLSAFLLVLCTASLQADEPKAVTPDSNAQVNRSLRVKVPSVRVQANPNSPQQNAYGDGQYAFIDDDGALTSTPPAGFDFPEGGPRRDEQPRETRSAVDPNAILIDTSHIQAVIRVRLDESGQAKLECFHSTDPVLQEKCDKPHSKREDKNTQPDQDQP